MEYLILNEHPHLKSRFKRLCYANRAARGLCALFKTRGYKRMKLHASKLGYNFVLLVGRELNLTDDDELFTVIYDPKLGYIVLSRGKVDVE